MTMTPEDQLESQGHALPEPAPPAGSYVPCIQAGDLVYVSGQLPTRDGSLTSTGRVGEQVTVEQGAAAARQAVLNALAQLRQLAGDLSRIKQIVRVAVYVNSTPGFSGQSQVANGASDLLCQAFGEAGRHARVAVGVSDLPMNAPVELEMTVQVQS
jgi:enamine deaminase RidA (YjgF/YER057c/UK114 family)